MLTHAANPDASDLDLLLKAIGPFAFITSPDAFLNAVGLGDMPTAQRYGILFGCIVFTLTVGSVLALLIMGGTFRRIAEQENAGLSAALPTSVQVREGRPLMLERLLDARERMMSKYVGGGPGRAYCTTMESKSGVSQTRLTDALLNVNVVLPDSTRGAADAVPDLIDEETRGRTKRTGLARLVAGVAAVGGGDAGADSNVNAGAGSDGGSDGLVTGASGDDASDNDDEKECRKVEVRRHLPEGYQENYVLAYRKCQERPGGPILSGQPEARYEAYARAYAGCGTKISPSYRRSYARLYESLSCRTHATEKEYRERYSDRPRDIIGRTVRLEALDVHRHLDEMYGATNGNAFLGDKPYDPREVWGFLSDGPFRTKEALAESFVFRRGRADEAAFAIVSVAAESVIGVILLTNDDPRNLSIRMEPPIVHPSKDGSVEQVEACFLLLDRLFGLGYRRVRLDIDSHDEAGKKLPARLGFTREGTLPKHMIVRNSNRDSNVYGLLNSDWDGGRARAVLFRKLHGPKALSADEANDRKEKEYDEWAIALEKQKKEKESAEAVAAATDAVGNNVNGKK